MDPSVGIVIATRDRREGLLATLAQIEAELGRPSAAAVTPPATPVVVVDNGSSDGTADAVRAAHPWVQVVALDENRGAAGRTVGAEVLDTDLVAVADDDSWWPAPSLARAAARFDEFHRMGLLAARVLVGPDGVDDPVCRLMADSPYRPPPGVALPGPAVLGFVACGAVLRRQAFLEVGGFHPRYGVGGEEALLALDLAAAGWGCAYVADVVARHHPSPSRDPERRRAVMVRNDLWTTMLRRPMPVLVEHAHTVALRARHDRAVLAGLDEALEGAEQLWPERRVLPPWLERQLGQPAVSTPRRRA